MPRHQLLHLVGVARASPACRPARYGGHVGYLLAWRRRLIAQKYDGSVRWHQGGRGSPAEMEALVVRMAHQQNIPARE